MATTYKYRVHRIAGESDAERHRDCELIALRKIAEYMHVKRLTPQQWYQRGLLPDHDNPELDHPNWWTCTIWDFADRTGRSWFGPRPPALRSRTASPSPLSESPPLLANPFAVPPHAA